MQCGPLNGAPTPVDCVRACVRVPRCDVSRPQLSVTRVVSSGQYSGHSALTRRSVVTLSRSLGVMCGVVNYHIHTRRGGDSVQMSDISPSPGQLPPKIAPFMSVSTVDLYSA